MAHILIGVLGVGAGGYYFYKKKYTASWTTTKLIENPSMLGSVSRNQDLGSDYPGGD